MADDGRDGARYYDDEPDPRWEIQPEQPPEADGRDRLRWAIIAVLVVLGTVLVLASSAQTLIT